MPDELVVADELVAAAELVTAAELVVAAELVEPPELVVPVELVAAAVVATGVEVPVPAAVVPADAGLSSTNCVRAASSAENRVPPPAPPPCTALLPEFELPLLAALAYEDRPAPHTVA
ncbi:MAG TPA: hypothetical protein VNV61_03310 [Steroidobacteraceae bacterium]|nr:hypothetical protein [Steroidobacteraceae bacterium]